ncbi:MAG: alpha/beta hydrolase [Methylobacterium mesophilicum]|nr:alpha/beta hydrolase [Methylobacterium mesophilicum]
MVLPRLLPSLFAFALMLALGGCAGGAAVPLVARTAETPTAPASAIVGRHAIFVATTRAEDPRPGYVFGGGRSQTANFARVDMTVPAAHKAGTIERRTGSVAEPSKFFTAERVIGFRNDAVFKAALRADIRRNGGRALVFIHGYRNNFDDAVYRLTQIVQDSGYKGTPVLFSWASAGSTLEYVYDSNSATAARDELEATLRAVAEAGATKIDVIAHSMGNWVTVEALRQLAIAGDKDLGGRLGDVVLASPDIDVDVFRAQMRRYGKPRREFAVLVSADDRALRLSGLIAGSKPRLGDYRQAADLARLGVTIVDLSNVRASDSLAHTKFADSPQLLRLLGQRLAEDESRGAGQGQITERVNSLAQGLGQTLGSAADIVITTPVDVLRIAVGR